MNEFPASLSVKVCGISKDYRIGAINRSTFRDEILYRLLKLAGKNPRDHIGPVSRSRLEKSGIFHALDNVSFEIKKGETIGLIGKNGAGKSTMLKILSRITTPTAGEAFMRGSVGALLEVGTGFHPELTGRENIFLSGTILGMSRAQINRKFDDIVDFSEVGPFLDTPVKRYSSGMYVKLAFSVASTLDTDILLVDEVLAVGDAAFQKKSLARMTELAASGKTIVFVSHNIESVKKICSRAIWFKDGKIFRDGDCEGVASEYVLDSAGQ